jgi:hypothetical protein
VAHYGTETKEVAWRNGLFNFATGGLKDGIACMLSNRACPNDIWPSASLMSKIEGAMKTIPHHACLILTLIVVAVASASAADIYITQNATGADSGANCANAHSATWFNANATGGNTYHLCGTFTGTPGQNMLISPAGAAGRVLTILFETGAVMTAPQWGSNDGNFPTGGAITVNSYVTVDGGTNGVIKNTLNGGAGTSCAGGTCTSNISAGIYVPSGTTDVEIKNLTIRDIYRCNGASTCSSFYSSGIKSSGSKTNFSVHDNTITGTSVGIYLEYSGSALNNVNIFSNTLSDQYWGINIGSGSAGNTTNNVNIYDNTMSNFDTWQNTPAHEDGIIVFSSSVANIFNIYNNTISAHGNLTGNVFCTYGSASPGASCNIFNNVLVVNNNTCAAIGGGRAIWLHGGSGPHAVVNNTMIGANSSCYLIELESPVTVSRFQNNIHTNENWGVEDQQTNNIQMVDHNLYNNSSAVWNYGGYKTFAQWQALGFDPNGISGDPSLDSNHVPQADSIAIKAATNLSSICSGQPNPGLGALCLDKNGAPRPSTGAWDTGAFQYSQGTQTQVAAPTGLRATAQ